MPEPFHDAMQAMLDGEIDALDPWLVTGAQSTPGLSVYRNTIAKARADALTGLFPTVERLVGADWFRQAALIFAGEIRPRTPVLDDYGRDFPAWLSVFPPAREMPYLSPIARLDLAWSKAHRSIDAPVLRTADVAGMPAAVLYASRVVVHPSAQMFWFDWTVPSIWLANRPDAELGQDVVWTDTPEGLLVLRPDLTVMASRLGRPNWMFLNACRDGQTLGRAAAAALRADPSANLSQIFAELLSVGVFTRLKPETSKP